MPFELKPGQGTLHRTREKRNDDSPDYFGELNVGGTIYKLSGWIKLSVKGGKWLSLKVEEPQPRAALETPRPTLGPKQQPMPALDPDDDIPF
jgi:uncharacterized protein (DUF736 family)